MWQKILLEMKKEGHTNIEKWLKRLGSCFLCAGDDDYGRRLNSLYLCCDHLMLMEKIDMRKLQNEECEGYMRKNKYHDKMMRRKRLHRILCDDDPVFEFVFIENSPKVITNK